MQRASGAVLVSFLALVVAAISLVDCASDRAPIPSPQPSPIAAPPPIIVNASTATSLIGPEGGTLTHPSGARIVVPPSALAAPRQLTLTGISPAAQGVIGGVPLAQGFEAGPEGQQFLKPIEVVLPFDPTRVPAGSDATQAQIHTAPQHSTSFVALQSSVDLASRVIRTTTVHFSDFVPVQSPNPVFITSPPSLPDGTVGANYSQAFAASGGTAPYTWSLADGALPPGLAITNDSLTGTPELPTLFGFFVKANDSAGHAVQKAFSLTVNPALNPVPTLTSVSPSSAEQGNTATVTLSGSGFVPNSQARWDGAPIPTAFVSQTQLSASVSLTSAGTHRISVFSPAPGGGTSAAVSFTVNAVQQNPVPTIASVSPTFVPTSNTDAQIAIVGTNFSALTSAAIGQNGISTSYVSATQLNASIPASYLASPGTLAIGVYNPPPGGGFSPSTVNVTVGSLNPVPTLSALSPSSIVAGSGSFTLGVTGTQFVSGGQLFFNSTALATTVLSATSASATVPASLITTSGTAPVKFVNPAPDGGASGGQTFTISPQPVDAGSTDAGSTDAGSTAECTGTLEYLMAQGMTADEAAFELGCPVGAPDFFGVRSEVLDITQATTIVLSSGRSSSYGAYAYTFLRQGCNKGAPNVAQTAQCGQQAVPLQAGRYTVLLCNMFTRYYFAPTTSVYANTSCATASTDLNPTTGPQHPFTDSEKLYFRVNNPLVDREWVSTLSVEGGGEYFGGDYKLTITTNCEDPAAGPVQYNASCVMGSNCNSTCWGSHIGIYDSYEIRLPPNAPGYWLILSNMTPGFTPSLHPR